MFESLISGLTFGFAAGLSPGPLTALVISQSVRFGQREGIKVAVAPLFSDVPVILLAVVGLSRLANLGDALAWISVAGGLFAASLSYDLLRSAVSQPAKEGTRPQSLLNAIVLNLLNPHVYLFWAAIGGPTIVRGRFIDSAAFLVAFYTALVGSKLFMAVVAGRSRTLLAGRRYRAVMTVLGAALGGLAVWLIVTGIVELRR